MDAMPAHRGPGAFAKGRGLRTFLNITAWPLHYKTRARRQHHDDTLLMSLLPLTVLIPLLNEVGGLYDGKGLTASYGRNASKQRRHTQAAHWIVALHTKIGCAGVLPERRRRNRKRVAVAMCTYNLDSNTDTVVQSQKRRDGRLFCLWIFNSSGAGAGAGCVPCD